MMLQAQGARVTRLERGCQDGLEGLIAVSKDLIELIDSQAMQSLGYRDKDIEAWMCLFQ